MKRLAKILIILLSFLPFFYWIPSLIEAWKSDPGINGSDPVFMGAALLLCALLIWRRYKEGVSTDWRGGLSLTIPAIAAIVLGVLWKQPMIYFPGAVLFGWGVLWIAFGWRLFYRLFPVPLLMLLSLPTTAYILYFPGITILWKAAIASALLIYALFALLTDFNPIRRRTAFFSAMVVVYALLYAAIPQV